MSNQQTNEWVNLAPDLVRQRLIIEGLTAEIVQPPAIHNYLVKLAKVTKMEVLNGPFTYSAHELGFGGFVHWRTSGAHFYSYTEKGERPPLFTIDTYTCKPFSVEAVVDFTRSYFSPLELKAMEIKV
ncbi:S-adenosylmethionine decarboxylase [Candidatus Woesearchaeota archaeon]|nr:S-adenosylmethionine decarboxylase [Candidatus Woesearchaeota archaeon]